MIGDNYNILNSGTTSPSGFGSQYDRLFANNPYRNLTYRKSLWQNFLSSLGFRTDADRWIEDSQVNAAEYDAGIYSMMYQNEYNDPSSQAARMRAAGLNPDLLGVGDVAQAATPAEDPNGMSPNVGDEFRQFGESFMGVLTRSIALYKDFKGIAELENIIEAGDIENAKNRVASIESFIQSRFQESDFVNRSSYLRKSSMIKGELENELLGDYEGSTAYRFGINKKDWKRWTESAGQYLDSLMGDKIAFSSFADAASSRASATEGSLNPLYTKTDEMDDTMHGLGQIVSSNYITLMEDKSKNDAYQEALRTGALQNQGITQDIEGQYLDTMHEQDAGVKQANSELAKFDNEWYTHRWQKTMADMKMQMLNFLREKSKHSRFANLMLMNWTLDNIVGLGINANASASVGLNLGLGANIANTFSTILKP